VRYARCEPTLAEVLRLLEYTYAARIIAQIGFSGDGTVNVGFENHGKLSTYSSAKYEITLEELPSRKALRPTLLYSINDRIPEGGEPQMPNHYHQLAGFTESDLALYKSSKEAVKVSGILKYDNGFGEIHQESFCWVSAAFAVMSCDGVDRYLRSLGK
jgi:hypothetical protein